MNSIVDMLDEIIEGCNRFEEETIKDLCEQYGLVGLPRDADDKPIHIGDLVRIEDDAFSVGELRLLDGGEDGCIWKVMNGAGTLIPAEALHHLAEDTPECILLEAVMRAHRDTLSCKDGTDVSDLLERLRELMGDDDK